MFGKQELITDELLQELVVMSFPARCLVYLVWPVVTV